jgi:tripartite-type tricarboxylate transporter receptor subunit TctC
MPTVAEQGLLASEAVSCTMASSRPASTPRPIVDKLNAALRAALGDPKVHGHIATEGRRTAANEPRRICGRHRPRGNKVVSFGEEVRASAK